MVEIEKVNGFTLLLICFQQYLLIANNITIQQNFNKQTIQQTNNTTNKITVLQSFLSV
jgi:hypothetical protein